MGACSSASFKSVSLGRTSSGARCRPRDPDRYNGDDDENEDNDEEEQEDREPAVIRKPDEDE